MKKEEQYKVETIWNINKMHFQWKKTFWNTHLVELMSLNIKLTQQKVMILNCIILDGLRTKTTISNAIHNDAGNVSKALDKMERLGMLYKKEYDFYVEEKMLKSYMKILKKFNMWFYDSFWMIKSQELKKTFNVE